MATRDRLRWRHVLLLLGGALLILALLRRPAGTPDAWWGTPQAGRPASALSLERTDGQPFDLAQMRGRVVLVFFGYTHCPDVCPMTLADLGRDLLALPPAQRRRIAAVFVTLDPQRDTGPVLRAYLDAFALPVQTIGLRGGLPAVARAAKAWQIHWTRIVSPSGQVVFDHTAALQAVGPRGHLRLIYGLGQLGDPARFAADMRRLLDDAPSAGQAPARPQTAAAPVPQWPVWLQALSWFGVAAVGLVLLAPRRRQPQLARWRKIAVLLGLGLWMAGLIGVHRPLVGMSGYTLALMTLNQLVPPLLLLGLRSTDLVRLHQNPWARKLQDTLTDPWIAGGVFITVTAVVNLPWVFDSALADAVFSGPIAVLQLVSGLLLWAQLLPRTTGFRTGWQAGLWAWGVTLPMMAVGLVWIWSTQVLYTPYLNVVCLWNLSPLDDQRWAGLLMIITSLPLQMRALWLLLMHGSTAQVAG
jgi:cytochrome oxidase Cu insertion factor (SCO1/SenC/PrrC family)/cytochrome c oxidase assembly factor CtaG